MRRQNRKREPGKSPDWFQEQVRLRIAARLRIDPDRIRYGPLPNGVAGKLGTDGDHWQIHYRDEWRELPWHHDGPSYVTRQMVIKWHGKPSKVE
ncbi:hypothetical protein SAMN06265222_105135 [Neorhodopirellula lusitana]|uniref:Uncharacterized protein n=1 Tax=Neorhodopirellula lusitana TaxID=445327 RepID=A0ABY1Q1E6_9BACT|nr:hypothetical protein [Neorhodopirellula lusitana]SMP56344.1 hypothetical protein SAMN06265222_105135 [Neorhodopirellula lusitana]